MEFEKIRSFQTQLFSLILICTICASAHSQNTTPSSCQGVRGPSTAQRFDVISIREHIEGDHNASIRQNPDGYVARNVTLASLISEAYGVDPELISGGPGWMRTRSFDLEAKFANLDGVNEQKFTSSGLECMLRIALLDRFKLVVRTSQKMQGSYKIVIRSAGKLHPALAADHADTQSGIRLRNGEIIGHAASLNDLAAQLSGILHQSVINETGLDGSFDFELKWTPGQLATITSSQNGVNSSNEEPPSIFTAIQNQLGLELKPTKTVVDTVFVQQAAMPTAN